MSQFNYCPECGKALSEKAKRCTCGWRKIEKQELERADHRCWYRISNQRCPLPGTLCPYPYANSPWYCAGHWQTLSDPKLGEAVLLDAEKNYPAILEDRRDWRRKLFNN